MPSGRSNAPERAIVLYDEDCAFCRAAVRFVSRRDRTRAMRFVPLQSPQAQTALDRHGLHPTGFSSVVYLEELKIEVQSTAVLEMIRHLGWPWALLGVARLVPRPLRDRLYRFVAAHRHWFGR